MSGFSKMVSVAGWRAGYLIADHRWPGSIGYFHDLTDVCAPAPFRHGVADGVEQLPPSFYAGLAADHVGKRALLGATAAEKARTLLRETGVASVAGSAFFRAGGGEDLPRFCFAKKDADLEKTCRRLRAWAPASGRA
jgi:aminotransferase